ncbi:hypothetical protein NG798_20715 [Ancylothrix sp. C2]|uniref:hypothetical protein n=1 Tax=Ancylothrix sp. D3o TaxID=2953691 RepID=UPI0021BB48A5|nr:hypothetical protein [Ancylothrix sp. D3o]MCT7952224.1 hypothetical protein [Ancylothrix sp. D3o]
MSGCNGDPGASGYDNNDHEYDYERDVQDSYDDWREQNASLLALERDAEREMWEANECDPD